MLSVPITQHEPYIPKSLSLNKIPNLCSSIVVVLHIHQLARSLLIKLNQLISLPIAIIITSLTTQLTTELDEGR